MPKAQHNRDLSFKNGFISESSMQNMREGLAHVKDGYEKPPKEIHQHHYFGERVETKSFTLREKLDGLLELVKSAPSVDLWVRIGRCYLALGNQEDARGWLVKAAEYNHPEAVELLKGLNAPAKSMVDAKEKVSPRTERRESGLPRVISTMVDIGAVKHGVVKYIILVLAEGESRFRPAVAVAHKYGVGAQNYYDSEDLALNAATKIRQEWGR